MTTRNPVSPLEQPDPGVLDRVLRMQKVCLVSSVSLGVIGLLAWAIPVFRHWLPGELVMPASATLVSLACATSLAASLEPSSRKPRIDIHRWLAVVALVLGIMTIVADSATTNPWADLFSLADQPARGGGMTIQVTAGFIALSVLLLLTNTVRGVVSHVADGFVLILFLLLLFLVSRYLFEALHLFVTPIHAAPRPATLATLALLSIAGFLSRARHGSFDILLGGGVSSRIARNLMILPVVAPFLREAGRVRLLSSHLVPEHGAAAFLTSISAVLLLVVLIIATRHIRRMETSIRHLSLRDELTGLYNLRGFKLLAEQALRLAQRSNQPFSLLFIDVDDLKQINDSLGHSVGSSLLAEIAQLLKASFRETDVVGRIGGDEFAVSGQLTHEGILDAARQLETQASLTRTDTSDRRPISLSIGYVTASAGGAETLEELLEKADAIMYNQKRRKKLQLC